MRRSIQTVTLKHLTAVALLAAVSGCTTGPGARPAFPPPLFLATLDGRPLPAPDPNLGDGYELVAVGLTFPLDGRPRQDTPGSGVASWVATIRWPDGHVEQSTTRLPFSIAGDRVAISLCPLGALCIIRSELVGAFGPANELVLTHYLGDQAKEVYRFEAAFRE